MVARNPLYIQQTSCDGYGQRSCQTAVASAVQSLLLPTEDAMQGAAGC